MTYTLLTGVPYGRRRALAGATIAGVLLLAPYALLRASDRPSPSPRPCPAEVAERLGVHWDPEQGATEAIEAFHFGIIECEQERGDWICWNEESADSPVGLIRICGTPTELNDTLSTETKVWSVDLHPVFPQCMEDQPCWDCRSMGNFVCGDQDSISDTPLAPSSIPSTGRTLRL